MKRFFVLLTILAGLTGLLWPSSHQPVLAQGPPEPDPLAGNRNLTRSSEIILLWSEGDIPATSDQKIYDFLDGAPANNALVPKSKQSESGQTGTYGNKHMDIATGDFNDDGFDDVIAAWEGQNNAIQLFVPDIISGTLNWTTGSQLISNGPLVATSGKAEMRQIHLDTGDFDADGQDEFVLAYQGSDEKVHLEVYDTNGTLAPQLKGSKNDMQIPGPNKSKLARFDVAAGDLDGDGDDEIVLVGFVEPPGPNTPVFVKVYEYDPTQPADPIQPQDGTETSISVSPAPSNPSGVVGAVAVATGDFDGKGVDEIALGFYYHLGQDIFNAPADSYLYLLQASPDLETLTVYEDERVTRNAGNESDPDPLDVATGDMNKDGRDEIAFAAGSQVRVYESDDNFKLNDLGAVSYFVEGESYRYTQNFIALQDLNADVAAELIVAVNNYFIDDAIQGTFTQKHEIDVYEAQLDPNNNNAILSIDNLVGTLQNETITSTPNTTLRHYALAVGDFDGGGIQVGEPLHFVKTKILRPLVILNSPPVHFDILNGELKDVSKCFTSAPTAGCRHKATYEQSDSTQVQIKLEVHKEYGLSTELGIGLAEIVDLSMKATYGQGFSKLTNSTQTRTNTFTEQAFGEDRMYATLVDYDIWEYPVHDQGSSQATGFIVVVIPGKPINTWFSTKDKQADTYRPDHEVGNILSYLEETNHPDVHTIIVDDQKRIMSGNSIQDWEVLFSDVNGTQTENSVNFGLEIGTQVSGLGVEVGVTGTYNQNEISTHSMTVEEAFKMGVHLDTIDVSLGEDQYGVIRYAYWRQDGTLVLDYAVPTVDLVGANPFESTWWDDNYGQTSDPAFLLPWRYDPEKFNKPESSLQQRTKDITFLPSEPAPGETVTISARVHNYSLKQTPGPIKVAFYLEDPDSGGTLLSEATTLNALDIRKNETVSIDWLIPSDYDFRYSRIYAVIDPAGGMSEIHETNNKGYTVLELDCDTCLVADLSLTSEDITFDPKSPSAGQPVKIMATIQSDQANTPDVGVSFYNGDPNAGGQLIDSDIISDFDADGTALARVTWAFPAQGSYKIFVVIEEQNGEPSSTNNQAAQTIQVSPAAIYLPLIIK